MSPKQYSFRPRRDENFIPRSVPFNKFVIGIVEDGWITRTEGEGMLQRNLVPTPVQNVLDQLSTQQAFRAKAKLFSMNEIHRNDNLLMSAAKVVMPDKTDEEIGAILDDSFRRWNAIELD